MFMELMQVIMSTYNGGKYIVKQIESILNQKGVKTYLVIRDDGSTDNTIEIIKEYIQKYPERIKLIKGENIGYRKSFLSMLPMVDKCKYYGFSDQDDIWLENKCIEAIKKLKELDSKVSLYASGLVLVDENNCALREVNYKDYNFTIEKYFTRARLAGCTFVFTEELRKIAEKFSNLGLEDNSMPDHDFVVGSCAFACGEVIIDSKSYIHHIRHKNAETSGGNGIIKRMKVEWKKTFVRKNDRSNMAKLLTQNKEINLNSEVREFLIDVANYKNSLSNQLKLLNNKKMKTGMLGCDLETKFKILIRNY